MLMVFRLILYSRLNKANNGLCLDSNFSVLLPNLCMLLSATLKINCRIWQKQDFSSSTPVLEYSSWCQLIYFWHLVKFFVFSQTFQNMGGSHICGFIYPWIGSTVCAPRHAPLIFRGSEGFLTCLSIYVYLQPLQSLHWTSRVFYKSLLVLQENRERGISW